MSEVTARSGMGAGGMPPSSVPTPSAQAAFPDDGTPARAETEDNSPTPGAEVAAALLIDEATAAAVEETRLAFFAARDSGAVNRIEQGQLLLTAQEQLAKYGNGTFTAMLVAPRPDGFGFKSPTSAYDLMAEAEGKPKRSHKAKSPVVSTPGRLNDPQLPMNLDGASSPSEPVVEVPDKLPGTLDTSDTHTYVAFRTMGVYVPKVDVEGFTQWLQSFSNAALSTQFLVWYHDANPSNQKEQSNETSNSIQ